MRKQYSAWYILILIISITVSSSILISFGEAAYESNFNPLLMTISWILGTALVLPEILLLSECSMSFPEKGGAYIWLKKINWQAYSFWFGWILIFLVNINVMATVCLDLGNIIGNIFSIKGHLNKKLIGFSFLLLVTILQFLNKFDFFKKIFFISWLQFIPLFSLIFIGIFSYNHEEFLKFILFHENSFIFFNLHLLVPLTFMTIFAYSGITSVSNITDKIKNPKKSMLRIFLLAFIIIFFIYLMLLFILLVLLSGGHSVVGIDKSFLNVWYWAIKYNRFIPNFFAYTIMALMCVFYVISFISILFFQSEFIVKMSEEKDLPKIFQKRTKSNISWSAILLVVSASAIYLVLDNIFIATTLIILGVNILKLLSLIAVIKLRTEHPTYKKIYKDWLFWFLIVFELIGILFITIGIFFTIAKDLQQHVNIYKVLRISFLCCFVLLGFPIYFFKQKFMKNHKLSHN